MRTVNYDRLATSTPIDKAAALARDGRTGVPTPEPPPFANHWDAPPPPERAPPRDLPRLEGRTFGVGMRVVRYHGRRSNGARWLVRCACGAYELRATNSILAAEADHACEACNWSRRVRWHAADGHRHAGPRGRTETPLLKLRLTLPQVQTCLRLARAAGDAALVAKFEERLSRLDSAT